MSEIIAPSVAARLRFFVTDPTTGVGVTGLTHSTITTAGYATELNGVRSSTTSVTLTSTAVATAALATGQVIEYGLGQYGIDVPAVGTSGLIFAVVTVTGKEVRAVRNQIREAAELNTGSLLAALGLEAGNLDEQLAAILTASGGSLTTEQNALLVSIAQWAARNNGGPMHYTGNVGDGGVLELTVGDDHETVMENDLPIVVKDPGGLFRAKLVASGSTLSWSAGQDGVGGLITGTVTAPTYDSGTELTTIVVQVPNCAAAGNITTTYKWQLKRTSGGKIKTELQGTLRLNADMS